jgi:spermidine/putrescine transport system substrate-binding protein
MQDTIGQTPRRRGPVWRAGLVAAGLLAGGAAAAADKKLTVFDWSGYEAPEFHQAYIDEHKASPSFVFFGDEEEAMQKLKAGFRADVAHPCSQSVAKWRDAGLIKPVDTARIKAWADILPEITAIPDFMKTADGKAWVVPFEWGNTFLVYNSDEVKPEDVTSLMAFADPKFAGKVSIGDNVSDAYALASLVVGVKNWQAMTDEEFQKASDFLRQVHKNVKLYWTDNTQLSQAMADGEVTLAWAWNETPTTLKKDGKPIEVNRDTKEGLSTWVCGYVLLKNGKGDEARAYDYLNAVLDPRVSPGLVSDWGYGHANGAGMAKVDPEELKKRGYDDVNRFIAKTLFQSPVPPKLQAKMNAEFERIKAGH